MSIPSQAQFSSSLLGHDNQPSNNDKNTGDVEQSNKSPQCFWHANGNLICHSNQNPPTSISEKQVEFDTFSSPNQNYQPNNYRQNKQYYEQPVTKKVCQSSLSPPLTDDRVKMYGLSN